MKTYLRLIVVFCCCSPFIGMGQDSSTTQQTDPWKRLELNVGGYMSEINSKARVGSEEYGIGIDIDMEKALGLQSTTKVFRAELLWAMGKKKRTAFQLNYYSIKRNSIRTIGRDVAFRDVTYSVGTTIHVKSDIDMINLNFNYSFFKTTNFNVGASLGIYVVPMTMSLEASGLGTEKTSVIAPLPTLGLYTKFRFSDKLVMTQSLNLFYMKYEEYEGSFTDINIRLEYNATKHVGLGLGINTINLDVSAIERVTDDLSFKGSFGYKLSGVLGYLKFYI